MAPYWMKWLEHDSSLTLSLAMTSTSKRPHGCAQPQPVMANFLLNVYRMTQRSAISGSDASDRLAPE